MMFKTYRYGAWKKEIRKLLQKRIALKDKIRYHQNKIKDFENNQLPKVEKELNKYLLQAGNKI